MFLRVDVSEERLAGVHGGSRYPGWPVVLRLFPVWKPDLTFIRIVRLIRNVVGIETELVKRVSFVRLVIHAFGFPQTILQPLLK
jgi:hypothetical protein